MSYYGPKEEKSHLLTLLLCFFLGQFGVHRFYTGYIGIGVAQLLTLGGCGLWAIVDLVSISLGTYDDSEGNQLADYNQIAGMIVLALIFLSIVFAILSKTGS